MRPSNNFSFVVGIGASAGGLDALARLLPFLKCNSNAVYIIAQHMARDSNIDLVLKLLQHHSSIPVVVAKSNELLVADHVFLIPPGVSGVVQQGRIQLIPVSSDHFSSPSLNALFNSVASDARRQAIGIVLSGVGTDGLSGCRSIRAFGGTIIAQSAESSQFDGMPGAVRSAKLAHQILSPEKMPEFFTKNVSDDVMKGNQQHPVSDGENAAIFKQLLLRIQETTGSDFSLYKEDTLLRRLNRRMSMLKIASMSRYLIHTQQYPAELNKLHQQFLISLSSFFRDTESFFALKQQINDLLKGKFAGDSIRVWVPGCASGEECYSWAILLLEILGERADGFSIVITGTDLSEKVIAIADGGVYPQAAVRDLSPELLARYFDADTGSQQFTVKSTVRSLCRFQIENVIDSPLLENVDAISCRNLLIYMKAELQNRLIKKFYDTLQPGGLLFLGQSETIGLIGNTLFSPVDHYHRLYRRKRN